MALKLINRSQGEIEAIYRPYSDAERMCMGYGAQAVWALVAPERFGHKMRPILDRHQRALNLLRTMFHGKPNTGSRIRRGRKRLGANLLLRDLSLASKQPKRVKSFPRWPG